MYLPEKMHCVFGAHRRDVFPETGSFSPGSGSAFRNHYEQRLIFRKAPALQIFALYLMHYIKKRPKSKGENSMKNTDNLRQDLMNAADLDSFLSDNRDNFNGDSVGELLSRLYLRKNISKASLAKQSGMSEVYLHQVFAGRRNPSRNRLLCLCFGLSATLEETQELLKQCGHAQLYPRNKRDAIILFGLVNGLTLFAVNDKLFSEDEETLY